LLRPQEADHHRFLLHRNGETVANPKVEKQDTCKKIGPREVIISGDAVNGAEDVLEAEVMMLNIIIT